MRTERKKSALRSTLQSRVATFLCFNVRKRLLNRRRSIFNCDSSQLVHLCRETVHLCRSRGEGAGERGRGAQRTDEPGCRLVDVGECGMENETGRLPVVGEVELYGSGVATSVRSSVTLWKVR